MGRRKLSGYVVAGTFIGLTSASWATPGQVCDLLKPYFDKPPSHFEDQRGIKTADTAWDSKSNPLADALNTKCKISKSGARTYFECTARFDKDQGDEQAAFHRDAVIGIDYCLGNLEFGNSVRRTVNSRNDANAQSEEVEWFKTVQKDYTSGPQFGADVTSYFYKSLKMRDVSIKLFYEGKP